MDIIITIASTIGEQLQKPTLAFLIGGMLLAALGSKFEVPEPVYKFIVILLLLKVGLGAGISMREADVMALMVPAIGAAVIGVSAGMSILDESGMAYEGFIGALYPFMDIAALVTAIVLAKLAQARKAAKSQTVLADGSLQMGGGGSQETHVEQGLVR